MTTRHSAPAIRRLAAAFLPAVLAAGLCACGGDGLTDTDLPAASITVSTPASFCGSAGSGSLSLDPFATLVTLGHPQGLPADYEIDRLSTAGSVSGLGMDDRVYVVITRIETDCTLIGFAEATLDGSGGFSAEVQLQEGEKELRVTAVVFNGAADPDFVCGFGDTCVSSPDGSFGATAGESITVRLPF